MWAASACMVGLCAGLYLPSSDMDVVVMDSRCGDILPALKAVANCLARRDLAKNIQVGRLPSLLLCTWPVKHCSRWHGCEARIKFVSFKNKAGNATSRPNITGCPAPPFSWCLSLEVCAK